jgi:hypothetical protein
MKSFPLGLVASLLVILMTGTDIGLCPAGELGRSSSLERMSRLDRVPHRARGAGAERLDDLQIGFTDRGPYGSGPAGAVPSGAGAWGADPAGGTSPTVIYHRRFTPVVQLPDEDLLAPPFLPRALATPSGYLDLHRLDEMPDLFSGALDAVGREQDEATLVHFGDLAMEEIRRVVAAAGIEPLGEIPNNAVVAGGVDDTAAAVLSRFGARVYRWVPGFFVSPEIGARPVSSPEMAVATKLHLLISVFPGTDAAMVEPALTTVGATVEGRFNGVISCSIEIDELRDNLHLLTGLPIRALAERGLMVSAGEESSTTVQTGEFNGGRLPYPEAGVDGSSQVIGITDTGISLDAAVLSDGTPGVIGSGVAGAPGLSHRKVVAYVRAQDLPGNTGGSGDLLSCDTIGLTHGHMVASVAAGNASEILGDVHTHPEFQPSVGYIDFAEQPEEHEAESPHLLDGVAPGARVYFIDDQARSACDGVYDIETQSPGMLSANVDASRSFGVNNGLDLKIHNLSFAILGSEASYTIEAQDLDAFLHANQDFLVVAAAGNSGQDRVAEVGTDGNLDYGSITSPGTAKNVLTVSATGYPNNAADLDKGFVPGVVNNGVELLPAFGGRWPSQGPAAFTSDATGATDWRIKPDLMAPGGEIWPPQRLNAPTTCLSGDDDQMGPVECLRNAKRPSPGTSVAAAGITSPRALHRRDSPAGPRYFSRARSSRPPSSPRQT